MQYFAGYSLTNIIYNFKYFTKTIKNCNLMKILKYFLSFLLS